MSKAKSSPPLKRSTGGRAKGTRTGCFILAGLILVGLIIAAVVFGLALSNLFQNGQVAAVPSGFNDKTSPEDVIARRETEEARLNSYGWLDEEAGTVRIPIDRAMALIVERGLPVGTPTATTTPTPTSTSEVPTVETPVPEPSPTATATPTPISPAEVSFENHVLPIFEQHCTECHGGDEPKEGLRLTGYEEVMAGSWNGSVIEPGDVEGSYLIEQVTTGRMPKEGPLLSPAEIQIITAWVEAGAPDN